MNNDVFAGLNKDEITSHAIKIVIAILTWVSARYLPPDVGASLSAYYPTIAAGLVALGFAGYGVYRQWNQKLVPQQATAIILPATASGAAAPPPVGATVNLTPLQGLAKVVGMLLIGIIILSMSIPAFAQTPNLHCLPLDARPACKNGIFAPSVTGGGATDPSGGPAAGNCQFGTFAILTPQNLVQTISNCGMTFLTDSQAALDSAKAANDNVATSCLTPGTALIKAGVGTPAVAGDPTATPPVTPIPAKLGGPVLLFQKYREFVNAGGISACEAWVNTVVAATVGAAANGVGLAAGAAILSPIK